MYIFLVLGCWPREMKLHGERGEGLEDGASPPTREGAEHQVLNITVTQEFQVTVMAENHGCEL